MCLPGHGLNYTLAPPPARERRLPDLLRHRILLIGDPAARPDGLERLLVRGGFQVTETPTATPPDLLLYTPDSGIKNLADEVRALVSRPSHGGAPVFVILVEGAAEAATEALLAGAQDVLLAPVHLPELRARLDVHIRARAEVREAQEALRARDLLFDIFQEVSAALRADEIFQTLVRRVGQAFGLSHCSFVLTAPGEDKGRVVAVYENPAIRDLRVDLERYPEIQEAIRTQRPVVIQNVHEHPLFAAIRQHWTKQQIEVNVQAAVALPVFVQGRAAGVFFLRTERGDPQLRPEDVAFANTIAQAAARVLENEERRSAIYRRQVSAGTTDELTGCASLDALDRRLRDEFERARRYSLHFSLVLAAPPAEVARRDGLLDGFHRTPGASSCARSTSGWDTPRAIACSAKSARSCSASYARRTSWLATAATSSPACFPRRTGRADAISSSGCARCSRATRSPTSVRPRPRGSPPASLPTRTARRCGPRTCFHWRRARSRRRRAAPPTASRWWEKPRR